MCVDPSYQVSCQAAELIAEGEGNLGGMVQVGKDEYQL